MRQQTGLSVKPHDMSQKAVTRSFFCVMVTWPTKVSLAVTCGMLLQHSGEEAFGARVSWR